jgi:taurine dioxygenase
MRDLEGLTPLTPHLGAIVHGVKLGGGVSAVHFARIAEALARYGVVVVKDQHLSAVELRDFVRNFGPLFAHHSDEGVLFADGIPEVLNMLKEPDGARLFGGSDWHADVTFQDPCGLVSVLHALIIPPIGGDTGFASTTAAFEGLSDGMRAMLRRLNAIHSYYGPGGEETDGLVATHPVVRAHPQTGAVGIYLNRMFVTRFEGMTEDESRPLIHFLTDHITRPEFTCRVSWQVGQVVMWDNRFTLHYPINDFVGERRSLMRCTALEG